jgi:hypothetical protein
VDLGLFDEAAEALRGLVPPELGAVRTRPRRFALKAWFGPVNPPREHYEAQVIGADHVAGATALALELGFHAEHPKVEANDEALARLLASESAWRRTLGQVAIAGPFLGRPDDWRRVSETWADPNLSDPDLAVEVATRLVDYITALEPLRRPARSRRRRDPGSRASRQR